MIAGSGEVFGTVREVLAEALGVDAEEVTLDARLRQDLDAESIDMLDIAFRLEKAFGVELALGDLGGVDLAADGLLDDGRITDAGMAELRRRLPHGSFDVVDRTRSVGDLISVLTVRSLVELIESKHQRA